MLPDRRIDIGLDALPDAVADTATAKDAAPAVDGTASFPQVLGGIWLVGYFESTNRFSWIRFDVTTMGGGTAVIGSAKPGGWTDPYWNCSGSATWNITPKPDTIQLHYPSSMCTGMKSGSFTFTSILPFSKNYPKGAKLEATLMADNSSPGTVSGYKFPPDQCNATMTSCEDLMP